jgi:tRNA pseudouridine38-40 synthase
LNCESGFELRIAEAVWIAEDGSVQFVTNWKLTLSYHGTGFHGWQVQPGLATVQGTLAEAIQRVTGERLLPQGSGRTDAGVHALAQAASFALEAAIPPPNLLRALNAVLPASIRILAAEPVAADFHARHSAIRKTYEYRVFERRGIDHPEAPDRICPPFLAPYVWDCRWPLDFDRMQESAGRLIGEHDFSSFAASDPDRTTRENETGDPFSTVRTLLVSEWRRGDETLSYFVTGTGFLHHMVRNIVGTLVEVGRGALEPSDIGRILLSRDRCNAGPTAPASGLFLVSVEYPEAGS